MSGRLSRCGVRLGSLAGGRLNPCATNVIPDRRSAALPGLLVDERAGLKPGATNLIADRRSEPFQGCSLITNRARAVDLGCWRYLRGSEPIDSVYSKCRMPNAE